MSKHSSYWVALEWFPWLCTCLRPFELWNYFWDTVPFDWLSQCEKITSILINSTMWAGFPVSCVGILLETCLSSEDIIKTHTKAANACKLYRSHLSRHKTDNVFFLFLYFTSCIWSQNVKGFFKKKKRLLQVHSYHTYKYGRDEDVIFIFHQTVALAMCLVMRHILCQNSLKSVVCVFRVSWYNMKQST